MMNDRFGLEMTDNQIKGYIARNKLNTGKTGRFVRGQESWNKGRTGVCYEGCKATQFKSGGFSHNRLPLGTERINEDGYTEVKYRDGHGVRNWRGKHLLLWEAENGPAPPKHAVIFLDGDKTHIALDNLKLVARADLVRFNQLGLPQTSRDATEAGFAVAALVNGIGRAKKRAKKRS